MNTIINLLKNFSYPDNDINEIIDLNNQVSLVTDRFKDTIEEKEIAIEEYYWEEDLPVAMTPLKLDLVVSNLIQNAIDALDNTDGKTITIRVEKEHNKGLITVTDNAGGIDNNTIKNLFNPYFTTKEVGKGMGLGLAIIYEILLEHEGTINVVNSELGAQFTIAIPLTKMTKHSLNYEK